MIRSCSPCGALFHLQLEGVLRQVEAPPCDAHDLLPVARPHGLVGERLEERQHLQEVVDGAPAGQVGGPLAKGLGQLPALVLVQVHL